MNKFYSSEFMKNDENINIYKYITNIKEENHKHDFIEIEYIWCGSGFQIINDKSVYVNRGDLLFFNFDDSHSIIPEEELGIINCLINPQFIANELVNSENALDILTLASYKEFQGAIYKTLPKIKFLGRELIEVEAIMEFMLSEFREKPAGYITVLNGYINVLLTKIFRVFRNSDTMGIRSDINKIAPEILKYIEENYDKKISLKQLSANSFYTPTYFSTIFKECFGKSLTEYITEKRINKAMKLLKDTDYSIELVAQLTGYNDKKQFYKTFKSYTGTTPSIYRKKIEK